MNEISVTERKRPGRVSLSPEEKLLVGREEAAEMLSISRRAMDYLVAPNQLSFRRIGSRVLIPVSDLKRFSRADHPPKACRLDLYSRHIAFMVYKAYYFRHVISWTDRPDRRCCSKLRRSQADRLGR
jgi:excisionase family DNA binding protein